MSEFKKAPEGQPTSSIETMLTHAKQEYNEWEHHYHDLQESVERAERMMNYWDNEEQKFEYQLSQRRIEGRE